MNQLNPGENFPIVRVLENPHIADTHYVRAVVKNAVTLATIATLDLTDNGDRLFSINWTVPSDTVFGRGTYVVITTSVYTDAGYSARSENYGDNSDTYLIQQRFNAGIQFGSGGGIDERTIIELFKKYLGPLQDQEPISLPAYPEPIDYKPFIEECFQKLAAQIEAKPVTPLADNTPLATLLQKVYDELRARPKFEKTDLAPLQDLVQQLAHIISAMDAAHREAIGRIEKTATTATDERDQIQRFTNGQGGSLSISMSPSADFRKTNRLRRLAAKYGAKMT